MEWKKESACNLQTIYLKQSIVDIILTAILAELLSLLNFKQTWSCVSVLLHGGGKKK